MNTCKQCSKEYQAKRATSQYCSPQCRVKAGRVSVTDEPLSVTDQEGVSVTELSVTEGNGLSVTPTLQHYQENPTMYAQRTNPELLNWGRPTSMHQLEMARLKANRVAIPGDHDYVAGQA